MTPTTRDAREYDPIEEACELNDDAVESYRAGRIDEVKPLYRRALSVFERALPEGHPNLSACRDNLAGLRRWEGAAGIAR